MRATESVYDGGGPPAPTSAAAPRRWKPSPLDIAFALLTVATAGYFLRESQSFGFRTDDWALAARGGAFGDFFAPYNDHLATVHIAMYKLLYEVFGFSTYLPWRAISIGIGAAIALAMYALYRGRVGSGFAFVAGTVLLWYPELTVVPTYFPLFLPLVAAIACAWTFPKQGWRYDVALAAILTFALCTSGTGASIAAACLTYLALTCRSVRRWVTIVVPTAAWALWWLTQPDGSRGRSITEVADPVFTGLQESFVNLAFGNTRLGGVLAIGFVVMLAWRLRRGLPACANELAWSVALLTWWFGVALSRSGSISDTVRYQFVGTAFVLLACLPTTTTILRVRVERRTAIALAVVVPMLAGILIVVRNKPGIDERTFLTARQHELIRQGLIVANEERDAISDDAKIFVGAFRPITAAAYRAAMAKYGAPDGTEPAHSDQALVRLAGVRPRPVEEPRTSPVSPTCRPITGPVSVPASASVVLRTGDADVDVAVQRFSPESTPIGSMGAHALASVNLPGLNGITPWRIDAPGACIEDGVTIQRRRPYARLESATAFVASPHTQAPVREVRFRLDGGRHHNTDLGRARLAKDGYLIRIDPTSIPNGIYELTAVVTDPAGRAAVSKPVRVVVEH